MSELNMIEILKKCRVCLSTQEDLVPIFQDLQIFEKTLKLHEVLRGIGDVELSANDELPKNICYGCVLDLTAAQKFRDKCKKSDRICKEILENELKTNQIIYLDEHTTNSLDNDLDFLKTEEDQNDDEKTFVKREDRTPMEADSIENETEMNEDSTTLDSDDELDSENSVGNPISIEITKLEVTPSSDEKIRRHKRYTVEEKTCTFCKLVFPQMAHLKIHMETHSTEKNYVCDVCSEAFKTHNTLKRHKERWHEAKEKLPACDLCGKNFFPNEMVEHMRSHTGERPYQCFYCKKQLVSKRKVLAHQRYVCKEVEVFYEDKETEASDDEDIKDILITEETEGLFVCRITKRELMRAELNRCPICKKKFTSELQLNRHRPWHDNPKQNCVSLRSGRVNPHATEMCEICGKRFKNRMGLLYHMDSHDEVPKAHECQSCDRKFFSPVGLRQHKTTVHKEGVGAITCEICDLELSTPRERAHHKLDEHPGFTPFKCKYCDQMFADKYLRHRHYVSKHRETKQFRCPICNLQKPSMSKVKKHMIVHTGEKPFTCELCDRKFGHKNNLIVHNRKFHGGT